MKTTLAAALALLALPAFGQIDLPSEQPQQPATQPDVPAGQGQQQATQPQDGPSSGRTTTSSTPSGSKITSDDVPAPAPKKNRPFRAGGEFFAQLFPSSSARIPGSFNYQMGVFTGGRFLAGFAPIRILRFSGLASIGYVAAGATPGNGDDGFMLGMGAEVALEAAQGAIPFLRLNYEWTLAQMSRSSNGTLADAALTLVFGGRFGHAFSAYLLLGGDYAGGVSFGLGIGLGYF